MGIHKASYNHISKNLFTFQAKKSTTLCADSTKKDLHIHAQRNEGCSLHPS